MDIVCLCNNAPRGEIGGGKIGEALNGSLIEMRCFIKELRNHTQCTTECRFVGWTHDFDRFSRDVIQHIQTMQTYFDAILDGQKIPHGFTYIGDMQ